MKKLLLILLLAVSTVTNAAYPSKPITLIVPFPPGGPTDTTARALAEKLSLVLKQSVVIENRGGAAGNIAAQQAAKSAPDGYTLFFGTAGTQSINQYFYKNIGYDPQRDFVPVAWVTSSPNVIAVNNNFPAKNLKELIALAKANPGIYGYANSGTGSTPHLTGELFAHQADIKLVHVPYKGSAPALTDVMAGHVPIIVDGLPSAIVHIRAGKLRALAVSGRTRSSALPDVPSISEVVPGHESTAWFGVFAPAGTPKPIIDRLNHDINFVLNLPEVRQKYADLGAEPMGGSPEKFGKHVKQESEKWGNLVKRTGINPE